MTNGNIPVSAQIELRQLLFWKFRRQHQTVRAIRARHVLVSRDCIGTAFGCQQICAGAPAPYHLKSLMNCMYSMSLCEFQSCGDVPGGLRPSLTSFSRSN